MIWDLVKKAKDIFINRLKTGVEADNVEDAIKVLQDNKQGNVTGAASTIVSNDLTVSRVLVSDSNGKVSAHGNVTTTELNYINGVTSNVQTQLNNLKNTSFDKNAASNTDFNTLKTNGIYAIGTTGDSYHAPTSNGGVLCVFASNSYILQVYFTTSAAAKVYYRTFIGSWGAWVTIK